RLLQNQGEGPMFAEQDVCSSDGGQCTTETATDTTPNYSTEPPAQSQADTTDSSTPAVTDEAASHSSPGVSESNSKTTADTPAEVASIGGVTRFPNFFVFAGIVAPTLHVGPVGVSGELVYFASAEDSGALGAVTAEIGPLDVGYGAEWSQHHGTSPIAVVEAKFQLLPLVSISSGTLGASGSLAPYMSLNIGPLTVGAGAD
ncbi:hypothetical protein, partial [Streptomyces sp. NPDC099088]|uniref:hypothetical protein n=1 Tax=Streptomyces sp. NPDC099088 TaxID=3366101 RepID=UPI00381A4D3F